VTDPHKAASVNPAGEYKGFGLGMMVDILCAVIGGGLIGKDIFPMFDSPIEARRKISHFFMAVDINKFIPAEVFKTNLQNVVDRIRMMPALDNQSVMVAGDPEKKSFKERSDSGIPIEENIFEEFLAIDTLFRDTVIS
jgi:LDH2 family malate/lactate/ureidoglycolate dehydrogenase